MDKSYLFGRVAYEVYSAAVGGKTFDSKPLPTFEELGTERQEAWEAAALAARSIATIQE